MSLTEGCEKVMGEYSGVPFMGVHGLRVVDPTVGEMLLTLIYINKSLRGQLGLNRGDG